MEMYKSPGSGFLGFFFFGSLGCNPAAERSRHSSNKYWQWTHSFSECCHCSPVPQSSGWTFVLKQWCHCCELEKLCWVFCPNKLSFGFSIQGLLWEITPFFLPAPPLLFSTSAPIRPTISMSYYIHEYCWRLATIRLDTHVQCVCVCV